MESIYLSLFLENLMYHMQHSCELFFQDGVVVDKLEGANPADLAQKIAKFVGSPLPKKVIEIEEVLEEAPADKNVLLKKKLEGIVASKPVMLFMKGSPSEPKCGFSRKVVDILTEYNTDIGSFDILRDEEVRQGMKSFSNWPTFPQLYISGEFIGGCDIITEMQKNGELKELLTEKGLIKAKESTIEKRLKALIHSSPTILFMKGSADAPRCGFSSKVVNVLREENISFNTFDILSDDEVREGLKKYSNWPTYPQLYHNGELIGGCDIILELKATGELKSELS